MLKRFADHPIYNYQFFSNPSLEGIGVIRPVKVNEAVAYRIVDWFGEIAKFPAFCQSLTSFALEHDIAYVDLYVTGVSPDLLAIGELKPISESVIIPNYLEPLVLKNVEISYMTSAPVLPFFLRGDGDQDRPSNLNS